MCEAERSAAVTHNHPEGIKGAQSVALTIHLARRGAEKEHIRAEIEARFGYDLRRRLAKSAQTINGTPPVLALSPNRSLRF